MRLRHPPPTVGLSLVAILLCVACGGGGGAGSPTAPIELIRLHLYPAFGVDPTVECSSTRIKVLYFVPKGQEAAIFDGWYAVAQASLSQVADFFEREFEGDLSVEYDVYPQPVLGEQSEYLDVLALRKELEESVFLPSGRYFDPDFAPTLSGEYTVWMVYYVNGANGEYVPIPSAAYPTLKVAFNPGIWLEGGELEDTILSAHEFGHLLAIPHPWEMNPPYSNDPGNIMGYLNNGLNLMQCYILEEVKRRMREP